MSKGEKGRGLEQGKTGLDELRLSVAQNYTEKLGKDLESVLVELRQCGEYGKLTSEMRNELYYLLSSGGSEVAKCDKGMISGIAEKLKEIQSIVASAPSKSIVVETLIKPLLVQMMED